MEIHHLGRLCLLVTALLSFDLYTEFSQIYFTFNASKCCSYLSKLLSKRPEVGLTFFAQFVTGIALFFALSVWLKVLNFSFRSRSHLRHGDCLKSKICDYMESVERPRSKFENGHAIANGDSLSVESLEYSESEGSLVHEDRVFDELSLGDFFPGTDICDQMELLRRPNSLIEDGLLGSNDNHQSISGSENSETEELFPEDQMSDELLLKELVKSERQKAEAALAELEKERSAASTAAQEAMSMILRLQRETSSIEIEAKQCHRLAEEKQRHDQGVIEFLRSIIAEQERDLDALEEELRLCRRRLSSRNHCHCSNGTNGFEDQAEEDDVRKYDNGASAMGESFDEEFEDELISSLEFDSRVL